MAISQSTRVIGLERHLGWGHGCQVLGNRNAVLAEELLHVEDEGERFDGGVEWYILTRSLGELLEGAHQLRVHLCRIFNYLDMVRRQLHEHPHLLLFSLVFHVFFFKRF